MPQMFYSNPRIQTEGNTGVWRFLQGKSLAWITENATDCHTKTNASQTWQMEWTSHSMYKSSFGNTRFPLLSH